jgi:hypothetical protein
MDWTQVVLGVITTISSLGTISLPIVLPVMMSRSHKKTRVQNSEGNAQINARIDNLCTKLDNNITTVHGLHLLDIIEHRPYCWETIRKMYEEYRNSGGNGHVEKVYNQWEEDYGRYYEAGAVPPILINSKTRKQ